MRSLTSEHAVCLWVPLFPLRCEERRHPELVHIPTALLAPTDTRRLWLVSASARRAGVRAGMTVSQAIGLCPALTLREPDPVHYDEAFTQLLLALETVSPVIEPAELGRVFVGVDGLERLHGGPERQLDLIARTVGEGEWSSGTRHVRLGWARGKFLAWVAAARARPGAPLVIRDEDGAAFLRHQPVAVLPIDGSTHRRLRQLGLGTLADVAGLPEPAIVSQFGREGRRAWQLARGLVSEPVTGRERPDRQTARAGARASREDGVAGAGRARPCRSRTRVVLDGRGHPQGSVRRPCTDRPAAPRAPRRLATGRGRRAPRGGVRLLRSGHRRAAAVCP
jgi:nucleotidyltransferase/DNA polymerase involved in DNA repair